MRFGLVFSAMGVVACSESGVKKFNATPEAYITSHASGDEVAEGTTETIRGQVADADNSLSDLTAAWLYNGDPVCPDAAPDDAGEVSCDVTFSTDGGEVTLTARDPSGEVGTARVTLEVQPTDAPTAEIASPAADGVYYADALITLEGTVGDAEDAAEELTVLWSSVLAGDLDGDFNTPDSEGKLLGAMLLDEGEHFITLTVTDSTDKEGSDSVVINVGPPNSAPTCAITAPASGSAGSEGETVMFEAEVNDVDVPANWLTVVWTSDKEAEPLGSSTPDSSGSVLFPYESLTVNTHVITMTVTDEMGADCTANSVYAVGTPPILNVTAPADGVTLNHSDAVVFEATVEDNEDLPNEVSLSWESDIDGVFSTDGADSSGGVTVSVDSLSAGDHVVTVTATDTDGLFVTDTVSFNLNEPPTAPTVTLEPSPATTNQMLVATASGSIDPEGTDTVTYAYEWFEDGVPSPESSSATFAAAATGKHHTYRVQVTASDGLVESAFGYAEANVINSEPILSGPTLSAATAIMGDVLTCTASATDIDPEDSPAVTYAWSDGSTGPTYTVSASDAVDSTITCTATADDGDGGTDTGTASATVTNSAPAIDTVAVTPLEGQVGDVLTCTATASDPDGEAPTIAFAWSDGSTGPEYTIAETDDPGSVITCTATATDAHGLTATGIETATVVNTDPAMASVTIGPDPAYNDDTLVCSTTATDADGGSPSITYEWTGGATGAELPLTSIVAAPGDTIACTATATDTDGGTATGSASIVIGNRSPTVGAVSVTPESPRASDTLSCAAPDAADPDDDSVTLTYAWTIDGSPAGDGSATLTTALSSGEVVTCTVTATDDSDATATASDSVTVGNTRPDVSDIVLTPSELYTNNTLTAVPTVSDADGDELTVSYAFSVSGDVVQDSISDSLSGVEYFDKGDTVSVIVTADDGEGIDTRTSDTLTVLNSPPTAPEVSITDRDTPGSCEDGWTLSAGEDRCLKAFEVEVNGYSAQANCEALGGNLVTIGSAAENSEMTTLLPEPFFWIGLNDFDEEGTFVWYSGETMSYTNWDAGEPNNYCSQQCGIMKWGAWDDELCNSGCGFAPRYPYICEAPLIGTSLDLQCSIDEESTDDDGDPVSYTFDWDVDGESYTDTETTTYDDDTVPGDAIGSGETWTCEVHPDDGEDEGHSASASTTIEAPCDSGEVSLRQSGVDFVSVCAGDFTMGCTTGDSLCDDDEFPLMPVTLTHAFHISQTEITQNQYADLMGTNPSEYADCGDDCPVENVSWLMAAEFANAMSDEVGIARCYDTDCDTAADAGCFEPESPYACEGYRLPTEAEWEYAAKCGENYRFAGSNNASGVAWYAGTDGGTSLFPVATKDPNDCGLYDLSGNVQEWNHDSYDADFYTTTRKVDPVASFTVGGMLKVTRGGKVGSSTHGIRIANRNQQLLITSNQGIRLVKTINPTESSDPEEDDASADGDLDSEGIDSGTTDDFCDVCVDAKELCPPLTDVDGNEYQTVQIGGQLWQAENLRVTRYRDGTSIPKITSPWEGRTEGAYDDVGGDSGLAEEYGRHYNSYAADDTRGLCPEGWHTPSNDEYEELIDYLGGEADACYSLRATHSWALPGTDESGFSLIASGLKRDWGPYVLPEVVGWHYWWASSGAYLGYYDSTGSMACSNFNVATVGPRNNGYPVRCIADALPCE